MTMPNIDDFLDGMIDATDAILGDEISYKPSGGGWTTVRAFIDYGEVLRDLGGSAQAIDSEVTVTLSKRQAAAKPASASRLKLPKLSADPFRPINVRDLGDDWVFGVQRV